ncbi:MAG: polyisoprenoid-binding protein [Cytophagales bacterium]|nr:MAG: polyisoprenoid-binding protein [Cytophagales bacterium]
MAIWKIDPSHSEVQFKVKHLVISTVTGDFKQFDATLESASEDFSDAKVSFTADINSISTGNDQRDGHLKSDDFFNAEKFPQLSFTSTGFKKVHGENYQLEGNLTIRDITKPVSLDVVYGGSTKDGYGNHKAGFELAGKINRQDFNLKWSAVTEVGSIVVSDEVRLVMNVQFAKQS